MLFDHHLMWILLHFLVKTSFPTVLPNITSIMNYYNDDSDGQAITTALLLLLSYTLKSTMEIVRKWLITYLIIGVRLDL